MIAEVCNDQITKRCIAAALAYTTIGVCVLCAIAIPVWAAESQNVGQGVSASRAAAIHECAVKAARFPNYTWGNTELYIYRACMASHNERE